MNPQIAILNLCYDSIVGTLGCFEGFKHVGMFVNCSVQPGSLARVSAIHSHDYDESKLYFGEHAIRA